MKEINVRFTIPSTLPPTVSSDLRQYGVPPGHFFYEMRCEILILILDEKIDSILISFLIFHLRFFSILILICDVKRGLNANNVNYWINSNIGFDFRFEIPVDTSFDY